MTPLRMRLPQPFPIVLLRQAVSPMYLYCRMQVQRGVQASACPAGTKADKTTRANGQLLQVGSQGGHARGGLRRHMVCRARGRHRCSSQSLSHCSPPTLDSQNQKLFSDFLAANTKDASDLQNDYATVVAEAWDNFYDSNCGGDDPTCDLAHEEMGRWVVRMVACKTEVHHLLASPGLMSCKR